MAELVNTQMPDPPYQTENVLVGDLSGKLITIPAGEWAFGGFNRDFSPLSAISIKTEAGDFLFVTDGGMTLSAYGEQINDDKIKVIITNDLPAYDIDQNNLNGGEIYLMPIVNGVVDENQQYIIEVNFVYQSTELSVTSPNQILLQPNNTYGRCTFLKTGQSLTLSVPSIPSGYALEWRKNGVALSQFANQLSVNINESDIGGIGSWSTTGDNANHLAQYKAVFVHPNGEEQSYFIGNFTPNEVYIFRFGMAVTYGNSVDVGGVLKRSVTFDNTGFYGNVIKAPFLANTAFQSMMNAGFSDPYSVDLAEGVSGVLKFGFTSVFPIVEAGSLMFETPYNVPSSQSQEPESPPPAPPPSENLSAMPVVTTPSPTVTGQSITGTGIPNAYIKVYVNTTFAFQVQVNNLGNWSITPQTSASYEFAQEESGKQESAKTAPSIVNQAQSEVPVITSTAPFYVNAIISGQAIFDTVVKVYKDTIYIETIEFLASDGSFGYVPTLTGSYQFTRTDLDRLESEKSAAVNVINLPSSALPVVLTPSPIPFGSPISGTGVVNSVIRVYRSLSLVDTVLVNSNGYWVYNPVLVGAYSFSQTQNGLSESDLTAVYTVDDSNPVYKAINVDAESRCDNAMQYAISLTSQNVNTILESQWQDSSLFTGLRVGLLVNIFARKKDKPNEKVYLGQIMTTLSNQITTY